MNNEDFEAKYMQFCAHAQNRAGLEIQALVETDPPANPGVFLTDGQLYFLFVAYAMGLGYQFVDLRDLLVRAPRSLASGDRPTDQPDSTTN